MIGRQKMHNRFKRFTALSLSLILCLTVLSFGMSGVSYALTGSYMCGFDEEHTHTPACYEEVLVCGKEEHAPLCGKEEHLHSLDCCDEVKTQVCGLPEHVHNAFCYNANGDVVCGMVEHAHSDVCYVISYELNCTKQEHSHTSSCIPKDEAGNPYEIHVHTPSCWQVQCTCGKEEHKHDPVACMFASLEGVENEAVWSLTIPYENLIGDWATDLVTVAASQLGYSENVNNTVLAEDGKTKLGYTRYGHWYGYPYGDWCAMFAAFCMHYAGIPSDAMPIASGVETWIQMLEKVNLFEGSAFYEPKPGDLVFITDDGVRPNHMGIIQQWIPSQANDAYGTTVKHGAVAGTLRIFQGNKEDAVQLVDISVPSYMIVGYVSMEKVLNRWNNINSVSVICGTEQIELQYSSEVSVTALDGLVPLRCFTSSPYYSEAMNRSISYLENLGVNADKSIIKLYEIDGLMGNTLCQLPLPDNVVYISGVLGSPIVTAFKVSDKLIIMICG